MTSIDQFERLRLEDIARELDLHPFEIARILGQQGLPSVFEFSSDMTEEVRRLAGVEVWWTSRNGTVKDANRSRGMVRSLAKMLIEHDKKQQNSTRADNLFRGLDGADQLLIRRAVNQLIREGILRSIPTANGLHVRVDPVQQDTLAGIANGSEIPDSVESLWN